MRRGLRDLRVFVLLAGLCLVPVVPLTLAACHAPVTVTTAAGQASYSADQIVIRLNELERVAIDANAHGALDVQTTRLIVRFTVSGDKTLAASPGGGRAVVGAAWRETKALLPLSPNPAVQAALQAVDLVLAAYSGGGK